MGWSTEFEVGLAASVALTVLAMSVSLNGQREPAPAHELAAWIAVGWDGLAAVDTYVMTGSVTACHAHLPADD